MAINDFTQPIKSAGLKNRIAAAQAKKNKWYKKWWGIFIIIILIFIFSLSIAFGIYIYALANRISSGEFNIEQVVNDQLLQPGPYRLENSSSAGAGAANPKITIVEFADFNCAFCQASYPTIRQISLKYKDSVKIIFRHYPIIQEDSLHLALASECAHEQGKFWNMHDLFFQTDNAGQKINLIARQAGLNMDQFNSCFDGQKYLNKIRLDFTDAQNAKIVGTPTWFINGHKIEGEIPKNTFMQIIDKMLNNS